MTFISIAEVYSLERRWVMIISTTSQGAAGTLSLSHRNGSMDLMIPYCLCSGSSKQLWYVYQPTAPLFVVSQPRLQELHNINLSEAAQRWLQHHSVLGSDDAVLIGISSVSQLEPNLKDW